jgi:OmpA-OmpF porin, OOP family
MKMRMARLWFVNMTLVGLAVITGCATAPIPYQVPISATPPRGDVAASQAVNVLDASGSHEAGFADGKATLESVVGVMPDGSYSAGIIAFGGFDREATGLSPFDRPVMAAAAKEASFLRGPTPVFDVLENDLASAIGGTSGRAVVVLISDGLATDYVGRSGADERTLDAARNLVASRSGETCFHTIQTGGDPAGAALMTSLAAVTSCGSARNASSLKSAPALEEFSRDAYLGRAGMKAATKTGDVDSDRDGVVDSVDACPNTLKGARVDSRGCWTLDGVEFALDSAELAGDSASFLKEDLAVLRANPGTRLRVDGHSDSDGSEAYNQSLSERRAAAVRDYLIDEGGINADRIEIKGFGESKPIVPNDSAANKRRNRRVELTIID